MQKRFYKKCLLTLMIAGVATSNAFPLHTFAAEQNVKIQQENANDYSLGPAGFQDVMAQTTSSIFAMDSYAKLIQNQQETDLSKISSINGELKGNMIQHQRDAKMNAAYWLNSMKPQIMKTDQNIMGLRNI
ncbi:Bacillus hemolytic enterotoxin (HBL) [Bacillus cereus]|nr:Bacillus hemolytic enterotoxin (HBL) [Bacillus cereus]